MKEEWQIFKITKINLQKSKQTSLLSEMDGPLLTRGTNGASDDEEGEEDSEKKKVENDERAEK
jgi:hypothetical protein